MQRVLITGGSGGIGSATVRACAARGLWPVVAYAGNERAALDVVEECGVGETLHLDLLDEHEAFDHLPEVDAVIHCAGRYSHERSLVESESDELWKLMQVNALGPLRLVQALLASGTTLKHAIVLLSTAVFCRGGGPYALSKATALAVCKLLAVELAPRGIRVDAIVPGWTETAMAADAALASGRTLDEVRLNHPDGQLLEPDEIGQLCVRLLLDRDAHEPGQMILWDLRDAREPVWSTLAGSFSLNPNL